METKHYLARLHTLAHMIDRGQLLEWSEDASGADGDQKLRLTIEVSQPMFWKTFNELGLDTVRPGSGRPRPGNSEGVRRGAAEVDESAAGSLGLVANEQAHCRPDAREDSQRRSERLTTLIATVPHEDGLELLDENAGDPWEGPLAPRLRSLLPRSRRTRGDRPLRRAHPERIGGVGLAMPGGLTHPATPARPGRSPPAPARACWAPPAAPSPW